jgi:hypothetical protein
MQQKQSAMHDINIMGSLQVMDKLREAAALALEALEGGLWDYGPGQDEHDKCNEVITALREALAQPQGEWVDLREDELETLFQDSIGKHAFEFANAVIAKFKEKNTPPTVKESLTVQTQGEPVAFEQWYEANVEAMNIADFKPWMSEAWDAAIEATKEKMKKVFAVATPKSTWTTDRIIAEIEDMK